MSPRAKRLFKVIGITAAIGIVGLSAVAIYVTRPAVQKKYALEILEQHGVTAEISHLQAGLGGTVTVTDIALQFPDGIVRCKNGTAKISLFSLLKKQIVIDSLDVTGLEIDLEEKRETTATVTASSPSPAEKKSSDISVFINDAAVTGTLRLAENQDYAFSLKGRKINSARGGEVFFTIRENHAAKRTIDGNINLAFTHPLKEIQADVQSFFKTQPSLGAQATVTDSTGDALAIFLESAPANSGQKWRASITPRGKNHALQSTGTITCDGAVNATIRLDLDSNTLALLAHTDTIPTTRITGTVTLADATKTSGKTQISLEGNIADFGKIDPSLASLPALDFRLQGDVSGSPQRINITTFDGAIGPEKQAFFAQLKLVRPTTMEKQGDTWRLPNDADDIFALTLNQLPLTLANTFLAKKADAWRVENGTVTADLLLTADGTDTMRVRTKTPLHLQNFAVTQNEKPYLEKIDGEIPFTFAIDSRNWKLDTNDAHLLAGSRALADITAAVTAPHDAPAAFTTTVTVHGDALAGQPAWAEILKPFSQQDWRAKLVTSGRVGDGVTFQTASLQAAQGDNAPILRASLLQTFDTKNPSASERHPLIRVEAEKFPLALATPFLAGATAGGTATGAVDLTKTADGIRVETVDESRITLHAVSYTGKSGKPLLKNLHLDSRAKIHASTNGTGTWSVDFSDGKIDAGDGRPLTGSLAIAWRDGLKSATANLTGDPTRLLSQPLLGNFDHLESAALSLKGNFDAAGPCDIKLSLANIQGKFGLGTVTSVTLAVTGTLAEKSSALDITAQLQGDENLSDLRATVTNPSSEKWLANVQGGSLHGDDITRLALIFSSSPEDEKVTQNSAVTAPDATPFWGTTPAEITLGIQKVITSELLVENTLAHLSVTPAALTLNKLDARVVDGAISGDARIDFDKKNPYALAGKLTLTQLPFSNVISLFSTTSTNCIEGKFDTKIQFTSVAPNRKKLVESLAVDLDFSSQNGRVRVFQMDNAVVRTTGNLAELAGGVADIVSGLTANTRTEKLSQSIRSFSKVQKYLGDFPYEQSTIKASRAPNGDITITSLLLQNDQLLIEGSGEINHRDNLAFGDSPLALTARLNAKSELASTLADLKLINGEARSDGYLPGPEFALSGSFNSIQNNLLSTLLKAAQGLVSQAGVRLNLQENPTTPSPENDAESQRKKRAARILEAGDGLLRGFGL